MPRTKLTPDWNTTSGWYGILPPVQPRKLQGSHTVDWAVIGAGVTGLAAARQLGLNRPRDKVMLLEALRFGDGVSGRNSGFVLGIWFHGYPPEKDIPFIRAWQRLNDGGRTWLDQLVREHQIQCQWSPWGQLFVSAGDDGDAHLEAYTKGLERLGHPHTIYDREQTRKTTGSDFHRWGVHCPETVLTNPAAMCRGLADTMPANVAAHDMSPVMSVRKGPPFEITTPEGTVRAQKILVCTNNWTPFLGFSWAKNTMAPGGLFASITRPLTDDEWAGIGRPGEFGLLPGSGGGSTVRLTQDRRIMMRNSYRYRPSMRFKDADIAMARANHRESIAKRWPSLAHVEIEHTWGGILAGTRNNGHIWGQIEPGIYASVACNASNVAKGTMAGRLLADYACGIDNPAIKDQLMMPWPAFIPPRAFLTVFALWRMARTFGVDTTER